MLDNVTTKKRVLDGIKELELIGIGILNSIILGTAAVICLAFVGVVKPMAMHLGKEIARRGFFTPELKKVFFYEVLI
jgi:hypothetical protein